MAHASRQDFISDNSSSEEDSIDLPQISLRERLERKRGIHMESLLGHENNICAAEKSILPDENNFNSVNTDKTQKENGFKSSIDSQEHTLTFSRNSKIDDSHTISESLEASSPKVKKRRTPEEIEENKRKAQVGKVQWFASSC